MECDDNPVLVHRYVVVPEQVLSLMFKTHCAHHNNPHKLAVLNADNRAILPGYNTQFRFFASSFRFIVSSENPYMTGIPAGDKNTAGKRMLSAGLDARS